MRCVVHARMRRRPGPSPADRPLILRSRWLLPMPRRAVQHERSIPMDGQILPHMRWRALGHAIGPAAAMHQSTAVRPRHQAWFGTLDQRPPFLHRRQACAGPSPQSEHAGARCAVVAGVSCIRAASASMRSTSWFIWSTTACTVARWNKSHRPCATIGGRCAAAHCSR